MRISVNGQPRETGAASLLAVLERETAAMAQPSHRGFALALNGEVVVSSAWGATVVRDGDRVEIVRAIAGG